MDNISNSLFKYYVGRQISSNGRSTDEAIMFLQNAFVLLLSAGAGNI